MVPLFPGQHLLGGDLLCAGAAGRMGWLSKNAGNQLLCSDLMHGWGKMLHESHWEGKKRSKKLLVFSLTWIPGAERFWESGATPPQVLKRNVEVLETSLWVGYCVPQTVENCAPTSESPQRLCAGPPLTRPASSYPLINHADTQLL